MRQIDLAADARCDGAHVGAHIGVIGALQEAAGVVPVDAESHYGDSGSDRDGDAEKGFGVGHECVAWGVRLEWVARREPC